MTPAERLHDCHELCSELRWSAASYTTIFRWQQTRQNYAIAKFAWFVSEVRRVNGGSECWSAVLEQLREWDHYDVVH
jgi:hypothetical protein